MRLQTSPIALLAGALLFALSSTTPGAAQDDLGPFTGQTDVGGAQTGSTTYDPEDQTFTIVGSGTNMWADRDEFRFVWKRMRGNFILRTRGHLLGEGVDPHRKIGWTIRPTLEPDAPHVTAAIHGDGLTSLQFRRTSGAETEQIVSPDSAPDIIQLERRGNRYIMSVATHGETFTSEEVSDVELGDEVYVGLYVCSHNAEVFERATFSDVRVIVPAAEDFVPYRDYIGANIEVLDVETGHGRIVHSGPDAMQAPNWTLDGRALIYNSGGRLYRFDLATREPRLIETGDIIRNNNDHVISFDGTMLGISSGSPEGEQSVVYTVPIDGGQPKRITPNAPSYFHGWSPDGRYLVYTGGRDGAWDIYRISANGGEETRLTTHDALDDGPEYTPDGEWIYFNSTRSGLMQLWRMRPDGSQQEQVTNDGFNNWFPHISPDGQWIAFISYSDEIEPTDHPWYKHVYLRLMPIGGGEPKVLAYVYGGQGTINVPSWSPDGRQLAFVSNTAMP
jgi:hypothetical protein